jgi:hypothetical protein
MTEHATELAAEVDRLRGLVEVWRERALLAEAQAAAARAEKTAAETSRAAALAQLEEADRRRRAHQRSLTARMTRPLRTLDRARTLARRWSG